MSSYLINNQHIGIYNLYSHRERLPILLADNITIASGGLQIGKLKELESKSVMYIDTKYKFKALYKDQINTYKN